MPVARRPSLVTSTLSAAAATLIVLALTRFAPSFSSLGPRTALFGWLGFVTLITACIPALAASLSGQRSPAEWGLTWGRTRRDALWLALFAVGAVWLARDFSRSPDVHAYYPRYAFVKTEPLLWLPSTLLFGAYGLAWETMFRGHLLLAPMQLAAPALRPPASAATSLSAPDNPAGSPPPEPMSPLPWGRATALLLLQTLLFVIGHLDKPPLEAWLSLPAGLFFGLLALRTRSVLPGFLLHFTLSTSVNLFCAYG